MALVSQCKCESPRLVFNKYTGKEVYVKCGKCVACQRARQASWITKLTKESQCHLYTFALQLDYNEDSLPKYDFSDDGEFIVENTPRLKHYYELFPHLKIVSLHDLQFDTSADFNYFVERLNLHHTCIPHASVYDIQKFKKRLNTYIKREITGKYSNFRSAIVSELGSTTLRPHYHGILYFDDERIVEKLPELVIRAWTDESGCSLGSASVEPDRGNFASYLAKYITLPSDLPSFYAHPALRPLFLTSRHPALGSLLQSSSKIREVFFSASPQCVEFEKFGDVWTPRVVSIGQNFENQLFPKCIAYDSLTDFERVAIYRCAIFSYGVPEYEEWLKWLFEHVLYDSRDPFSFGYHVETDIKSLGLFNYYTIGLEQKLYGAWSVQQDCFSQLIYRVTRGFDCEGSLRRLYSQSKRIYLQSQIFGVSVDYYISRILKYHSYNKPQFVLRQFYKLQEQIFLNYPHYDYRYFYPLTYMNHGFSPDKAPDAVKYHENSRFLRKRELKNHFKNRYFESLKYKDSVLYNLLNRFYHAKECNEAVETIA